MVLLVQYLKAEHSALPVRRLSLAQLPRQKSMILLLD
jgi:hypothetical protein